METTLSFSARVLDVNAEAVTRAIADSIRQTIFHRLHRRGAVVGLSGGIDSSVTAALCAKALGKERVVGLLMPEDESSEASLRLGRRVAEALGIGYVIEEIGPTLKALGCYERRDDAIRKVIPEYGPGWKSKIVLPDLVNSPNYALYFVVAQSPTGQTYRVRLTADSYCGVVAATNFKQRTRKMMEYFHADRLWYAVAGTPNRLEYAQGFFVKNGDGAADFKPIAHLYKSQVVKLGFHLGVPEEVLRRPPTTDTYSLEQSQEEFYFSVPLEMMDLCLYAKNHKVPIPCVADATGLSVEQVGRIYEMIDSKLNSTRYLHLEPQLVEKIEEVNIAVGD